LNDFLVRVCPENVSGEKRYGTEFMYSIKSRDITHSIALFYKTTDSKNQFFNLKKSL
jgi:hypothetical protein